MCRIYIAVWDERGVLSVLKSCYVRMPKRRRRAMMVPRRCKQRAGFAPAEGFCIVDMSLLAVEFETMAVCGRCKKGTLRLNMSETKQGFEFAAKLLIECSNA